MTNEPTMEMTDPGRPGGARQTTPDRPAPGAPDVGRMATGISPGLARESDTLNMPAGSMFGGTTPTGFRPNPVAEANGSAAYPAAMPVVAPVPDALALLKALRHRWLLTLSLGLVCAALASTATWFLLPRTMSLVTASALLYMKSNESQAMIWSAGDRTDWYTFKRTQCDLIKTRPVLEEALKDPLAAALPIAKITNAAAWLEKQIKINMNEQSEVIEVSMTGEKPAQVTILVNAVVDAYLKLYVDAERIRREQRLREYEKIHNENIDDIQKTMRQLHAMKRLYPEGDKPTDITQRITLENFMDTQKRFYDISSQLTRLKLQLDFEQSKGDKARPKTVPIDVPQYLIDEQLDKDPEMQKLKEQRNRLNTTIAGYMQYANTGNKSSSLVQSSLNGYKSDLNRVNKAIEERRAELQPGITGKLRSSATKDTPEVVNTNVDDLNAKIKVLTGEQEFLKKFYEDQKKEVEKFYGKSSAEIETLTKEIERKQEIAKRFSMEVEALKLELRNPPRIRKIQDAIEPETRDPNRQSKTIILAGISAFLFVGFCTAWFEFRSRRIHHADEIVQGLGIRLLGTIPALPEAIRRQPLTMDEFPDRRVLSVITESIDGIRTMLLHESRFTSLRTVMITSAVSNEGKTTFSTQLAMSLSHSGHKTLLIDGDMVKPTANILFNLPMQPGLSEVLRGEVDTVSAIVATPNNGPHFMPAGRFDRQVSQILAKGGMQRILDMLKEEYEFIIVDSSPVLSVANTLLIGQNVDAVILSILRDSSQVPRVYAAYQRLAALGIRIMGAVFNKARSDSYYGSYGYYGYGSGGPPAGVETLPASDTHTSPT